jgi:hypothetical protein
MPMVYLSDKAVKTLDECVRLFEEFTSIKTNYSQAVTTLFKLSSDIKAFQRVKNAEKARADFEKEHPEMTDPGAPMGFYLDKDDKAPVPTRKHITPLDVEPDPSLGMRR